MGKKNTDERRMFQETFMEAGRKIEDAGKSRKETED